MSSATAHKDGIVVINAGSSSVKFAVYAAGGRDSLEQTARGEIEGLGLAPHFLATDGSGAVLAEKRWKKGDKAGLHDLLKTLIEWIEDHLGPGRLAAAGHRVALGGLGHSAPVRIDGAEMEKLRALVPLAPLHQPHNLEPIGILKKLHPGLPQVACFDTAFHRTMPKVAELYGLPRRLIDAGAQRYGFHGLSYEYIASVLPKTDQKAASGRTVVAHLGSGASMCAMAAGRSVATTMGFSPLSGILMGTRPGELDPGIVIWLLRERGMDVDQVESMLYRESGLAGVSGVSSDMRALLASDDPRARQAIDLFVYRIGRELASLAAALQGLDALVFTGGIGENAAPVRAAVCRQSAWLGIALDEAANARGGPRISTPDSRVSVWVIPTDEEMTIARHTAAIVLAQPEQRAS